MIEKSVKNYFNVPEKIFINRGPIVAFIDRVEEKSFFKLMKIRSSDRILDFACGLGRWSLLVYNSAKEVIAIDISNKLIKSLKKKRIGKIKPIVGSDEKLKQFKNYFDKIIFAQALEFYDNPYLVLKRLKSSLKDGGELYLSTWTKELIEGREDIIIKRKSVIVKKLMGAGRAEVFCRFRTRKEILEILKKCGFNSVKVQTIKARSKQITKHIKRLFGDKFYKNPERKFDVLIVAKAKKVT